MPDAPKLPAGNDACLFVVVAFAGGSPCPPQAEIKYANGSEAKNCRRLIMKFYPQLPLMMAIAYFAHYIFGALTLLGYARYASFFSILRHRGHLARQLKAQRDRNSKTNVFGHPIKAHLRKFAARKWRYFHDLPRRNGHRPMVRLPVNLIAPWLESAFTIPRKRLYDCRQGAYELRKSKIYL